MAKKVSGKTEEPPISNVLAEPDSKQALLEYADWLTANNDPQGEFIRLEVELDGASPDNPLYAGLQKRWSALYQSVGKRLVAPLKKLKIDIEEPGLNIRRGVIANVAIQRRGIVPEKMDELFAAAPMLVEIALEFKNVPLAKIVKHPKFSQIRILDASGSDCGITLEGVRALANSPYNSGLVELNLNYNEFGDDGAAALASDFLSQLKRLELRGAGISSTGLKALLKTNCFENLIVLNLGNNELDEQSLRILATTSSLKNLRELSLVSNRMIANALGSLGQAAFTPKLRSLNLSTHYDADAESVALLANSDFKSLEDFDFSCNNLNLQAIKSLVSSRWFANLKRLNLCSNGMPPDSIVQLAKVKFRQLEQLNLSWNPIGSVGLKSLLASPSTATLRVLELCDCEIDDEGLTTLVATKLPQIEDLDLTANPIGAKGARVLAKLKAPLLKTIRVSEDSIGNEGMELLRAKFGESLVED